MQSEIWRQVKKRLYIATLFYTVFFFFFASHRTSGLCAVKNTDSPARVGGKSQSRRLKRSRVARRASIGSALCLICLAIHQCSFSTSPCRRALRSPRRFTTAFCGDFSNHEKTKKKKNNNQTPKVYYYYHH